LTELVLATRNKDKITEICEVLGALPVKILTFEDIGDLPIVEEDGRSLYENALKKASIVASHTKRMALADDSGLQVRILDDQPGVRSARFAGEDATYDDNNRKLLKLLEGIPAGKRIARFRCVMVIAFPGGGCKCFEGTLEGSIANAHRGVHGFGYDPIFSVKGSGKTLAELPLEEKNRISHRGKALAKVSRFLSSVCNGEPERDIKNDHT
jgi:XTP/dITP diphosphohydrolase